MPIRLRLTLVVAAAAILLTAIAGLLGTRGLRASLLRPIDQDLARRIAPIVRELNDFDNDGERADANLADLRDEVASPSESFAQVLDPSWRVLAASPGLPGEALLSSSVLAGLPTRPVSLQLRLESATGEQARLLAVPVTRQDGRYLVVAGSSLATVQTALDRVRVSVIAGGVAVVALGSLGAWLLAGAALAPVERLRAAVAAIPPDQPRQAFQVPTTRDELAALARTMNQLLGRISQALERERRLIADASHELRTPLTVLRAELELANQPGRSHAELVESVRHAVLETDRITRLAEDLLLLARTDQSAPVVRPVVQLLDPVLSAAVAAASARASTRGIALELDVDEELRAPIDADRLRQAVDNLLDNALRAAPPGSVVGVHAGRDDGMVILKVSDEGPGFPPEFLPHAFERFRRADAARTRQRGGAGLGLAIVDAIARGHGGHAEVANRAGGGALVRLVLPGR